MKDPEAEALVKAVRMEAKAGATKHDAVRAATLFAFRNMWAVEVTHNDTTVKVDPKDIISRLVSNSTLGGGE